MMRSGIAHFQRRRGFTLVEALAAITIIAIVLPTVMYGVSLATNLASTTRQRNVATTLAESKLNELVATNEWQSGATSGDFGDEAPGFHWEAVTSQWQDDNLTTQNLTELDVTVSWTAHNQPHSVKVSTMVYVSATTSGLGGSSL